MTVSPGRRAIGLVLEGVLSTDYLGSRDQGAASQSWRTRGRRLEERRLVAGAAHHGAGYAQ